MKSFVEDFFFKNLSVDKVFALLSRSDYYMLKQIQMSADESEGPQDGVYLSDLADHIGRTTVETSKIVKHLDDKGYIIWSIDDNKEKTIVKLSEKSKEMMLKQSDTMKDLYEKIIATVPKEDLDTTLKTVHAIREMIEVSENFG